MKDFSWNQPAIRHLISQGIEEDQGRADLTTSILIEPSWRVKAVLRSKQVGVVAGLPLAQLFFEALDRHCRFKTLYRDGASVRRGALLARIEGRARSILAAERPALNALQHLSGIASYTHRQVQRLGRSSTRLLDTRKTLPGWRILEKYAVRCGGGTNHRISLGDAILIKENHLKISREAGADWRADVTAARARRRLPIQVEIQTFRDLREAITIRPERVLLDNLSPKVLRRMIRQLRTQLPRTEIEISGGVEPDDLPRLARLGVERISMGRLTHSAPAFDCSLEITDVDAR